MEGLRELGWFCWRRDGFEWRMPKVISNTCRWGGHQEDGARLFTVLPGGKRKDSEFKLKGKRFGLGIKRGFFPMRTARH